MEALPLKSIVVAVHQRQNVESGGDGERGYLASTMFNFVRDVNFRTPLSTMSEAVRNCDTKAFGTAFESKNA